MSSLTLLMLSALPCLTKASFLSAGEARHQGSACTKSSSSKNTACFASSKTTIRTKVFENVPCSFKTHGPEGNASEGGLFSPKAMFLLGWIWRAACCPRSEAGSDSGSSLTGWSYRLCSEGFRRKPPYRPGVFNVFFAQYTTHNSTRKT